MVKEVDMKEASPAADKKTEEKDKMPVVLSAAEAAALLFADLRSNVTLIEKSVSTKESRFLSRALRQTGSIRRKIQASDLIKVLNYYTWPAEAQAIKNIALDVLQNIQSSSMEVDEGTTPATTTPPKEKSPSTPVIPEVEIYLLLLVNIFLLDQKRVNESVQLSTALVERLKGLNRRALDPLAATAYFYYSRSFELADRLPEIRMNLLAAYRTASLRHDDVGQATLLNLILRNYLAAKLYDQADKLVSKATFPEGKSNNQLARYLYYQGRIKSVQLDYTEAYRTLQQAIRKAPQSAAVGFRQAVNKLSIIVQLLMGDMPERGVFDQDDMKRALKPYFQLTQAVRVGDLASFRDVLDLYAQRFVADKTISLINRLRHNVIKTGLRKINLAYSRISIADVALKLHLDSSDDPEGVVAKAIRDGVIDATLNYEGKYMQSKENANVYFTHEPQQAFHKRISFCLNIYTEAVKAMSFPEDAHKGELESPDARRERQQQEQELAKKMEDTTDDEEF